MQYTTQQLIARIQAAALAAGLDPAIAVAQLAVESANFAPYYVYGPGTSSAPANAKGLAQFIDATWARFGAGGDPFNPDDALVAWARYMTFLLQRFNGDYRLALAGYHNGEGGAYAVLQYPATYPKGDAYWRSILQKAGRQDLIDQPRPTRPLATKRRTKKTPTPAA